MRARMLVAVVMLMAVGCGPNVLTARGKVMNPLVKDTKELTFVRRVVIVRKEPALEGFHAIVGPYATPRALGVLYEPAEIPPQITDGSGLLVEFEIYSVHKDALVNLTENYTFWLILPDGRRIKGEPHRVWALRDLTDKVTGGAMRTHLVVQDKSAGTVRGFQHWEEVENEFDLYWRRIRVVFTAKDLITLETPGIVLEAHGEQRLRRYIIEFTSDPLELMDEEEKADYLNDKGSD